LGENVGNASANLSRLERSLLRLFPPFDDQDPWVRKNRVVLAEKVSRVGEVANARSMADIGCGDGSFTKHMVKFISSQAAIVGCDLDNSSLRRAKINAPGLDPIRCDATSLPIRPESFELVFSKDLLHHATNRKGVLREFGRIAKRSSRIIIVEGNRLNPIMLIFARYGNHNHMTPESLTKLARSNLEGKLKFETVDAHPYYAYALRPGASPLVLVWDYMWLLFKGFVNFIPAIALIVLKAERSIGESDLWERRRSFNVVVTTLQRQC